jgi:hypothetical protein
VLARGLNLAAPVSDSIICERSFKFAVRIVRLCDRFAHRSLATRHVCQQLLKSGTSIGSNAEEGQEAQTKPDYLAKMGVARKEARETSRRNPYGEAIGQRAAMDSSLPSALVPYALMP